MMRHATAACALGLALLAACSGSSASPGSGANGARWTADEGGFWDDPANWSGKKLPGEGADVFIDLPPDEVVVFRSGTARLSRLTVQSGFVLRGGTLEVDGELAFGSMFVMEQEDWQAPRPALHLAHVVSTGAELFRVGNGGSGNRRYTWRSVRLACPVSVQHVTVEVVGGLRVDESLSASNATLVAVDDQVWVGGGSLDLNGSSVAVRPERELILGAALDVFLNQSGLGMAQFQHPGARVLVNRASVAVEGGIANLGFSDCFFVNQGVVTTDGGEAWLSSADWLNEGSIEARSGAARLRGDCLHTGELVADGGAVVFEGLVDFAGGDLEWTSGMKLGGGELHDVRLWSAEDPMVLGPGGDLHGTLSDAVLDLDVEVRATPYYHSTLRVGGQLGLFLNDSTVRLYGEADGFGVYRRASLDLLEGAPLFGPGEVWLEPGTWWPGAGQVVALRVLGGAETMQPGIGAGVSVHARAPGSTVGQPGCLWTNRATVYAKTHPVTVVGEGWENRGSIEALGAHASLVGCAKNHGTLRAHGVRRVTADVPLELTGTSRLELVAFAGGCGRLVCADTLAGGGALVLEVEAGYDPPVGTELVAVEHAGMSGAFAALEADPLPSGAVWSARLEPLQVVLEVVDP